MNIIGVMSDSKNVFYKRVHHTCKNYIDSYMAQNLYQILNEKQLINMFNSNSQKLIMIMFSSTTCNPCKTIKPVFVNLSKEHPDCLFVYIDIINYKSEKGEYTSDIKDVPSFRYYLNYSLLAKVDGAYESSIIEVLVTLKKKIHARRAELEKNATSFKCTEEHLQKLEILNAIYNIAFKLDLPLNEPYNLDSNMQDLIETYKLFTNVVKQKQAAQMSTPIQPPEPIQQTPVQPVSVPVPSPVQTPIQPPVSEPVPQKHEHDDEKLRKTEKMKQINDLNKFKHMMEVQQLNKLQQLKALQKMKEQQEQSDRHNDRRN